MSQYTPEKTIVLAIQAAVETAVKQAVKQAKKETILECRPVGSYFITETEDDPNVLFGGEWQKLTGRYVLQCSDANHKAGTTVEAGLPNITGFLGDSYGNSGSFYSVSGAFKGRFTGKRFNRTEDNNSAPMDIDFDASWSNPIYGRSDTVQPPARIVNVWKRIS